MSERPNWTLRFTHPTIEQVEWPATRVDRVAAVTTEDGSVQAWAWDLASDERRRVSSGGVGAEEVHLGPDGEVVWWLDEIGDERGRWLVSPFDGGAPKPLLPGYHDEWTMGLSLVAGGVAAGFSTDDDYRVYVAIGDEPPREVYRNAEPAGVGSEWPQGGGGLSPDAALVCIRHSEDGDIDHQALRILDARSGERAGDQVDEGHKLEAIAWSPARGVRRLAFTQERTGIERPGVWDLDARDRIDLAMDDVDGPVLPLGWTPDGDRLLAHHDPGGGTQRLLSVDPASGASEEVASIEGTIHEAGYRSDGRLWLRVDSSVSPPSVVSADGDELLQLGLGSPPPGTRSRWRSWRSPGGDTIHGFLTTPPGSGPFPTIASIHGGPEWHHSDLWDPGLQAFVDEGFAVLQVNYRGSTGRGKDFRERLKGNIGFPESEDIVAGVEDLVDAGIADPGALFLEGWSWGGYLTTLIAGRYPDRWRAGCAGIPVGDYVAAHYESAPALRAWDHATMGGSPMDLPELYRERNPMTYVDDVRAPLLLIAGEHDSRCPLGQVMTYAHALKARGHEVDVHLYPGGHHALDVEEQIAHTRMTIEFFRRHLAEPASVRAS